MNLPWNHLKFTQKVWNWLLIVDWQAKVQYIAIFCSSYAMKMRNCKFLQNFKNINIADFLLANDSFFFSKWQFIAIFNSFNCNILQNFATFTFFAFSLHNYCKIWQYIALSLANLLLAINSAPSVWISSHSKPKSGLAQKKITG